MPSTHILLVEDDSGDALIVREHLHEQRWHFQWTLGHARTLAEARELILKQPPDVILLDLTLPDSRGLETYSRMQRSVPHVPIVVMSGLSDEALALSTIQLGAQDYIPKNELGSLILTRTIRYAIERNRIQAELAAALNNVKTLRGLLPICSRCKKIRDDRGYWQGVEDYICEHSDATFSHGMCPECAARFNEEIERLLNRPQTSPDE